MSIKRRMKSVVARSGLAVGDFQALQREVHALGALVETNGNLLRDLQAGRSAGVDIRQEFDSLATANAEAMVYLNRTLREIRSEMLSISAAIGRLETESVARRGE